MLAHAAKPLIFADDPWIAMKKSPESGTSSGMSLKRLLLPSSLATSGLYHSAFAKTAPGFLQVPARIFQACDAPGLSPFNCTST